MKTPKYPIYITCPECGCPSDSIKCYTLPDYLIFIGVYAMWREITYVCCPHCMRKHILIKGFTYTILAANGLWPFLILPWSLIQLCRSYTKGHSRKVLKMIEGESSEE